MTHLQHAGEDLRPIALFFVAEDSEPNMDAPLPAVIERPEQLTPPWLTAALRAGGLETTVAGCSHRSVGTGQMADSYRVELELVDARADVPRSLVVKLPSADSISRASGARGAYASEVRFYLELASRLAIRVPECHYGAVSDDAASFVLILEDLAPGRQGDQLNGCSVDQAHAAVVNLAGLHAPLWCDAAIWDLELAMKMDPDSAAMLSEVLKPMTEGFVERYRSRLSADDVEVLGGFAAGAANWVRGRSERFALLHGDYRLDNLLFATSEGGYPVATVDWQTLGVGLPARDLAYFLGNGLTPEARRDHERRLVSAYHDELLAQGVAGYPLETCWEDYRYGQFQGPLITVLGAMSVKQTDRGDDMFMVMASRACRAIRDLDALDLL
ncbi:ecdysteroid 22-kinase family protein [Myxococcota bacterium]|nr:ecdysteroid 22-kinase family protein [Myxococcota bacterium]